jgi:hypothetical protein
MNTDEHGWTRILARREREFLTANLTLINAKCLERGVGVSMVRTGNEGVTRGRAKHRDSRWREPIKRPARVLPS